ncbi:holin-like protein [Clostridium sp. DSM 8431]|uniref:CidA/LrgA family protein n=1 Tax=Clostridium sp. DSM 8431 TaxID=1761781 RepID=UPI0008E07997|nr:CidA/LrgA family protein [Clostridium sp. DSM 8431]SFU54156.1 holin-like protein [Clostridium sp. DSM 8431]
MKLFREAIIVFGIYILGDLISKVCALPIPGNIVGMLILLILLCTKVVKVEQVETTSNFLLDHLAFFFIPAGVQLMESFGVVKDTWIRLIIICVLTTIITMGSTGVIVQLVVRKLHKDEETE